MPGAAILPPRLTLPRPARRRPTLDSSLRTERGTIALKTFNSSRQTTLRALIVPPLIPGLLTLGLIASWNAPRSAHAAAWTAPPRSIYAKLSYSASSANEQFGFGGLTRPIVDGISDYPFADRSVYLYAEYGLKERLTLIGQLPFKRVFVHDRLFRYRTTGLGDVGLGARYRLGARGPWVLSAAGLLNIPTGYSHASRPPLGPGSVDVTAGLELGRSFYPRPGYATAALGYTYRSSARVTGVAGADSAATVNYADQLRYTLETGWTIRQRVTLKALVHGVYALRAGGTAFTITSIPSSERYFKVGGGAALRVTPHFDLTADVGVTPFGRNTAKSIDITLGVATSW